MSGRLRILGLADRYVARLFTASYLTAWLLVVGLFLIIDLATNLDEYLEPGPDGSSPPAWMVVQYYAFNLPFLYLQVAPFVTLVAGLFAVARLVRDNEVVAALNAGVSAQRLLAPLLFGGALLAVSMFALREWCTEELGLEREHLKNYLLTRAPEPVYRDLWLRDRGGTPVHLEELRVSRNGARAEIAGLSAVVADQGRWISLKAEGASWEADGRAGRWVLSGATREEVSSLEQRREEIGSLDILRFTPLDARLAFKAREQPLELSFEEARELAARDPDNTPLQTLLHYHLSFPLANLVLLLVGLPFLLTHERGRGLEGVALGFALCLFYYGADFVSRSFGLEGEISPLLACWLPLLFFGSLGVVLYGSMRS